MNPFKYSFTIELRHIRKKIIVSYFFILLCCFLFTIQTTHAQSIGPLTLINPLTNFFVGISHQNTNFYHTQKIHAASEQSVQITSWSGELSSGTVTLPLYVIGPSQIHSGESADLKILSFGCPEKGSCLAGLDLSKQPTLELRIRYISNGQTFTLRTNVRGFNARNHQSFYVTLTAPSYNPDLHKDTGAETLKTRFQIIEPGRTYVAAMTTAGGYSGVVHNARGNYDFLMSFWNNCFDLNSDPSDNCMRNGQSYKTQFVNVNTSAGFTMFRKAEGTGGDENFASIRKGNFPFVTGDEYTWELKTWISSNPFTALTDTGSVQMNSRREPWTFYDITVIHHASSGEFRIHAGTLARYGANPLKKASLFIEPLGPNQNFERRVVEVISASAKYVGETHERTRLGKDLETNIDVYRGADYPASVSRGESMVITIGGEAAGDTIPLNIAKIISPKANESLSFPASFTWTETVDRTYQLLLGSSPGRNDFYASGVISEPRVSIERISAVQGKIYARLLYFKDGVWTYDDYIYNLQGSQQTIGYRLLITANGEEDFITVPDRATTTIAWSSSGFQNGGICVITDGRNTPRFLYDGEIIFHPKGSDVYIFNLLCYHSGTMKTDSVRVHVREKAYDIGDSNQDGRITVTDSLCILGAYPESQCPGVRKGDVNGDGVINGTDAHCVLRASEGHISLPCTTSSAQSFTISKIGTGDVVIQSIQGGKMGHVLSQLNSFGKLFTAGRIDMPIGATPDLVQLHITPVTGSRISHVEGCDIWNGALCTVKIDGMERISVVTETIEKKVQLLINGREEFQIVDAGTNIMVSWVSEGFLPSRCAFLDGRGTEIAGTVGSKTYENISGPDFYRFRFICSEDGIVKQKSVSIQVRPVIVSPPGVSTESRVRMLGTVLTGIGSFGREITVIFVETLSSLLRIIR